MGRYALDMEKYADLARTASAEGCVLLKNDNSTLPLKKGDKVAVFGRMAFHYYKSGLGSGGLVNTRYVVGILDALRACKDIALDEELIGIYEKWIKDHPYDEGEGWGLVPWSQEEMPVTEEMLQTASGDDVALVILGRTAGEDQDNTDKPGSYKLTRTEEDLIRKVSSQFSRTVVILNVGNIIDMKWVREFDPAAVLYALQKISVTIHPRQISGIYRKTIIKKISMWDIGILRHLPKIKFCIRLDLDCRILLFPCKRLQKKRTSIRSV